MSLSKKLACKGTLGLCLSEFIDWRYSQSCWYFRTSFVNCCPSDLLSDSTLPTPSPFSVLISILYTRIQCVRGVWGSGPKTDKHLPQTPFKGKFFRWRYFALPSMSLMFPRLWHFSDIWLTWHGRWRRWRCRPCLCSPPGWPSHRCWAGDTPPVRQNSFLNNQSDQMFFL